MTYLLLKLVHVFAVIIFLGNITTGLFWATRAHATRDFRLIASTFDTIIRSDRLFTMPGVAGILVAGIIGAIQGGFPILGTGWILWPIVLFSISGIVFGATLVPLQKKIARFAASADASDGAWTTFDAMYRKWEMWGLVALLTPVAAAAIMILKPALPGL